MLSKINRLKNTKEIDMVFKRGGGVARGGLFFKFAKNGLNVSRFAFVAGKKIIKKAAHRNQIKRRLRDIIKRELPRIREGFDLVVIVQKGIENRNFQEIKKESEYLLKKANLLI